MKIGTLAAVNRDRSKQQRTQRCAKVGNVHAIRNKSKTIQNYNMVDPAGE